MKSCLLNLDLKPFSSQVNGKHPAGKYFWSLAMRGKKLFT